MFYGGNDGMLRAINGNRGTDIGPVGPGGELWSFMAPEFYGKIKRIRDNTIAIDYPGSSVPGAQPKAYGMDGPITAFQGAIAGIAKVFVYAGMRRGGRALYAFDVSAPSTPALMWKVGCPAIGDDSGCTVSGALDFSGIGQTCAPAVTMHAAGHGSGTSALLMMGGGYDDCEDVDSGMANHDCATPKGNKIYVLDAETGALLKVMDTERSVAGGITVVPDAVSGLARYAYAADTGGNLYRIGGGGAGKGTERMNTLSWKWLLIGAVVIVVIVGGLVYELMVNLLATNIPRWEMFLGIMLLVLVFWFRRGITGYVADLARKMARSREVRAKKI